MMTSGLNYHLFMDIKSSICLPHRLPEICLPGYVCNGWGGGEANREQEYLWWFWFPRVAVFVNSRRRLIWNINQCQEVISYLPKCKWQKDSRVVHISCQLGEGVLKPQNQLGAFQHNDLLLGGGAQWKYSGCVKKTSSNYVINALFLFKITK